ncbi:MAG: ribosome maturation factor RimM [Hyphomicrobiales bacterium]|nr:MAG: ribosome maturation factor RimM [Hyphomicrobiales bacterium]
MPDLQKRVLIGRIVGAHGIRGDVVIHSFAAVPEDIGAYGPLSSADGSRNFVLSHIRPGPKGVVARVKGVADRNSAEALKGTELFVSRAKLPEPEDGEFYVNDLIGMTVVDSEGHDVGRVVDAPDYGAGPLLEIRKHNATQTELIPFTDAYVPEVDLERRRVVVRPLQYAADNDDAPTPE